MKSDLELELRSVVSEGLHHLKRLGVRQSRIASKLNVSEATVSRWARGTHSPSYEQALRLAEMWPHVFDADLLADLYAAAALGRGDEGARTAGVRVLQSPQLVYQSVLSAIEEEPANAGDRVIRQVAFHLDRRDGRDPVEADPYLDDATSDAMRSFRIVLRRRAAQGWLVRQVLSVATVARLEVLRDRISGLDGPNVRVRAYAIPVPQVINLVIVGTRDVFMAVDHPRWERPGSAIALRHVLVARWAIEYFDELFHAAPIDLRTPAGVVQDGFDRLVDVVREAPWNRT